MIKEVKSALDELCKEILSSEKTDLNQLVSWSRELYENLVVISYLEHNQAVGKTADDFEESKKLIVDTKDANETINPPSGFQQLSQPNKSDQNLKPSESIDIQENNNVFLHQKSLTIKEEKIHVDTYMPGGSVSEKKVVSKAEKTLSEVTIGLNERLATASNFTLGLNDKIAFTRHLFEGNENKLSELVRTINQANQFEDAIQHFYQTVSEYAHWQDKKEYVTRFENLIRRRFGKPEIIED